MTEEELQSLDSIELEEQIKFQKSTAVVASQDVDFVSKWMVIYMYMLPLKFSPKNQQRR